MDQAAGTSVVHDADVERAASWLTVPELAIFLRTLLDLGKHEDVLRFMLDGLNKIDDIPLDLPAPDLCWPVLVPLSKLPPAAAEFFAEPTSLGDQRWDTLIACSAAYVARRRGIVPPRWTVKPALPQWWWPAGEKRRRALTMQRTPIDFRRVGIWFSERNFLTA